MKIDYTKWKPFIIGDYFDIHPTKAYKDMSKEDLNNGGQTPFVVNSAENNGIGGFSTFSPTEDGGIITFSDTTDGNTFFFQPNSFIGFAHVQGMYSKGKKWSIGASLFLVTILTHTCYGRYNYGRKMTRENILSTSVLLPSEMDGSPDFESMESYIKALHHKPIITANTGFEMGFIYNSHWGKFRLGDLFEIKKGKRLTAEDQTDGDTPYIGAIDSNNGIANYIGQPAIYEGNTISLSYNGSVGEAFYQPKAFWATDDVNVLYFRKENGAAFNKFIALFICTILKKEKYRYCYGRKWVLDSMNETIIELPTLNNEPDWQWMEDYVKSLPFADRI